MYTLIILFVGFTAAYSLIWHFQSSEEAPERRPSQKPTAYASEPNAAHPDKGGPDRNSGSSVPAGDITRKV